MKIIPVIHYLDHTTSLDQAAIAFDAGADGIFVISHHDDADDVLIKTAIKIKSHHPDRLIGLNLLGRDIMASALAVEVAGLDMVWGDACGVSSLGLTEVGHHLSEFAKRHPHINIFASVAFKYQAHENNPELAAEIALNAGFIPTTSGSATGVAAPVEKVKSMSYAAGGTLAIASGMTIENVKSFAPYLSHILVATGVSNDDHHFDFETLSRFIAVARRV